MMTPEEKDRINKMLKEMGSTQTIDELEAIRKRCVRTLQEWSSQDETARKSLPQDIKDLKMITGYAFFMTILEIMPAVGCRGTIDMAIEAAYNLGKSAPKS